MASPGKDLHALVKAHVYLYLYMRFCNKSTCKYIYTHAFVIKAHVYMYLLHALMSLRLKRMHKLFFFSFVIIRFPAFWQLNCYLHNIIYPTSQNNQNPLYIKNYFTCNIKVIHISQSEFTSNLQHQKSSNLYQPKYTSKLYQQKTFRLNNQLVHLSKVSYSHFLLRCMKL